VTSGSGYPTMAVTSTSGDDVYPSFRDVRVRCSKAGALTVARAQWSLDGGANYSAERIIPSDGVVTIPNVDLKLTFQDTTYTTDYSWSFRTDSKQLNTVDLTTAEAALAAQNQRWPLKVYCTNFTTSSQFTTFFSAVDSDVTENAGYKRRSTAMVHIGSGTFADLEQAATEVYASTGNGIDVVQGYGRVQLSAPFEACIKPVRPLLSPAVVRCRQVNDPGQNPAARVLGPLAGVTEIDYDEFLDGQKFSDDIHRCINFRTLPGNSSLVYMEQGWTHGLPGTSYKYHQNDQTLNIAEHVTVDALSKYVNSSLDTVAATGFLTPRAAKKIEADVNSKLNAALLQGTNSQGGQGYVSDVSFTVNRSYDVKTNEAIEGSLSHRPFANVRTINVTIGNV